MYYVQCNYVTLCNVLIDTRNLSRGEQPLVEKPTGDKVIVQKVKMHDV